MVRPKTASLSVVSVRLSTKAKILLVSHAMFGGPISIFLVQSPKSLQVHFTMVDSR